jgi:UDP-N-acetylmuramoylalanine--D-glutamate ligase
MNELSQVLRSNGTVWVAGAAASGLAAATLLKRHDVEVFVSDGSQIQGPRKEVLRQNQIPFEEGTHSIEEFLKNASLLVLSPAIPLTSDLPYAALQHNIPVVSEVELASCFRKPGQIWLGVTGTNGKSTTTHYLAQLMQRTLGNSVACGNIGLPVCSVVESADCLVVELSSYQLETTHSKIFEGCAFLNLQEDHLKRYEDMTRYFLAKWRIAHLIRTNGTLVLGEGLLETALKLGQNIPKLRIVKTAMRDPNSQSRASAIPIQTRKEIGTFFPHSQETLPKSRYGRLIELENTAVSVEVSRAEKALEFSSVFSKVTESVLPGDHNALNVLAASLLATLAAGVPEKTVVEQWCVPTSTYKNLPHRLENCGNIGGVFVYNDSKATNLESVKTALKSFTGNIHLLLGGDPKGEDFRALLPFFQTNVVCCYPFGKARTTILSELSGHLSPSQLFNNSEGSLIKMLEASEVAIAAAKPGDVLLLAPGCASFDEFQNFEHRGDIFKEWVQKKQRE